MDLITLTAASERFRISKPTLTSLHKSGKITRVVKANQVLVSVADCARYVRERYSQPRGLRLNATRKYE